MPCKGKIVSISSSADGIILVGAQFEVDGVPEPNVDYKSYFPDQIKNLTKAQIITKATADLQKRCEQIILSKYKLATGTDPMLEQRKLKATEIIDTLTPHINDFTSIEVSIDSAEIRLDDSTTINIKPDGTTI